MASKKKAPAKKTVAKKKAPAPKKKAAAPKKTAAPKKKAPKKKKKAAKKQPANKHVPRGKLKHAPPHEIAERLTAAVEPELELAFRNPFELLIATILAAQSTDRTVNQVMPHLLARYPDAQSLADSEQEDVERIVLRTGFFRNKAKAIRGAARALADNFDGEVPNTMEELVALPGVARKTANVVLGTAFGINAGFIVDTHVMRVSQRLALTRQSDPGKIEAELCAKFPPESWVDHAHRFTLHGRYTCLAKAPMCFTCPLNELCPSRLEPAEHDWAERAQAERNRAHSGVQASRGH